VQVTNRRNGHSVVVRINDRGPFIRGRVIDVTPAAARALGFSGLAPVMLTVLSRRICQFIALSAAPSPRGVSVAAAITILIWT
jgi:rare lipoprotein A